MIIVMKKIILISLLLFSFNGWTESYEDCLTRSNNSNTFKDFKKILSECEEIKLQSINTAQKSKENPPQKTEDSKTIGLVCKRIESEYDWNIYFHINVDDKKVSELRTSVPPLKTNSFDDTTYQQRDLTVEDDELGWRTSYKFQDLSDTLKSVDRGYEVYQMTSHRYALKRVSLQLKRFGEYYAVYQCQATTAEEASRMAKKEFDEDFAKKEAARLEKEKEEKEKQEYLLKNRQL
jgi:hypothetical protein